ncbi:MAG TPA: CPBP family intramembrane glutamic endopeptidase [Gemmatimonadaceae bacterium]
MTFTTSWTLWLLAAMATTETVGFNKALFFLPGTVAPAVVALWLNSRTARPDALWARLFEWQVSGRYYLFAISYIIAAKLTAAMLYRGLVGQWPAFGPMPLYLLLFATLVSTPVQAGEEIGWRGYALPRLAARAGLPAASLVLGAIWALWHLPLFLMSGTDSTGQPFLLFTLAVIAVSVAMTWLYVRAEGSLLLVMLMHAAINNTTGVVPSSRTVPGSVFGLTAPLMAWLTIVVLWIGAAFLLARLARTGSVNLHNGGTA